MEIDRIERTPYGCTIRITGRGTFEKDLAEQEGEWPEFCESHRLDFHISGEGDDARIERLEEYYSTNFDDAKGVGQ
jgi:hypothetical protein